jgi:hypothetical protein
MRRAALVLAAAIAVLAVPDGAGAAPACTAPPYPSLPKLRPVYRMDVRIADSRVTGTSDIRFAAERPLRRLVLRLWPNGPGQQASLAVSGMSVDGRPAQPRKAAAATLVVPLAGTVAAGRPVRIRFDWRLELSDGALRMSAHAGYVRLGSFFPILPWDAQRGWVVDPPTSLTAEASTSPTADFDVTVHAPASMRVLATGRRVSPERWLARGVRDFAIAGGPFVTVTRTVAAPRPVRLTVAAPAEARGAADAFADRAVLALTAFAERFGPYPWPTLSIAVMPDLGRYGIEYPNLIFQGPVSLDRATSHEVAHQWFYSLVGNDQARDPWLDESLANWAAMSVDHFEGILSLPIPPAARGHLGDSVSFWQQHPADYFAGVYVQGPQALASLGDQAFVDCALRRYVAANAYGIAQPRDLVSALEAELPGAAARLAAYGVRTGAP